MVTQDLVVSLLATYAASEYLHGSRRRAAYAVLATLVFVWLPLALPALGLRSKVPLVAACFLVTLYVDVRGNFTLTEFLAELAQACIQLLPLFPVFSVLFAFIFLELGELCEHVLGMSDANISLWLNWPIYYSVLYGPFAFVYVKVKAASKTSTLLPRSV